MKDLEIITKVLDYYEESSKKSEKGIKESILKENKVMYAVIKDPFEHPRTIENELRENGVFINVYRVFEEDFSSNPHKRVEMIKKSKDIAERLFKFYFSEGYTQDEYINLKKMVFTFNKEKMRDKVILHLFLCKLKEVKSIDFLYKIELLGYSYSTRCLAKLADWMAEERKYRKKYDFGQDISIMNYGIGSVLKGNEKGKSAEEAPTVNDLRNTLELVMDALDEHKENIENFKQEEKAALVKEFFQTLNSKEYGYLLDNFVRCEKSIIALKKSGYEFPEDVRSIPVLIRQYMKFIRDYGVSEIDLSIERRLTLEQAKNSEYEGMPFMESSDEKQVKTLSPGWKYKDVVISVPKYGEIIQEEGV